MPSVLAGKYEVLERLAVGGMAEVFLARLKGPGDFERRLVIKRVLPNLAAEDEFRRLFEHEARYAALLEHPNVAQVFDFGHDDEGRPWLAMEYVDGASMRALLKAAAAKHERTDVRLVAHVFARVAEGLAAAHGLVDPQTREPLHLVHRDVSPDNVLVSRHGAVKVSDFGIARAMAQAGTTRPDQMRGKLRYLAPEQLTGEAPSAAVDVWALGVCLYEALAGQRPFAEENEGQTVTAIVSGQRPPLTASRPDCPRALVDVVDACLAVDVAARMPDCHELALALSKYVAASGPPITTAMLGAWVDRLAPASRPAEPVHTAADREPAKDARWLPELGTPRSDSARPATPAPSEPGDAEDFVPTSALSARVAAMEPTPGSAFSSPRPVPPKPTHTPPPVDEPERVTVEPQRAAPAGAVAVATPPRAPVKRLPWRLPALGLAALLLLLGVGSWRWRVANPPEPEPARVIVTSTPSGATVRIDGAEMGRTPWAGDHRGATPFELEVSAPGYAPYKQTLPPGEASSVSATLQRRR